MSKLPYAGLEVFLAIAEQGSLRGAAKALGVGPPAISHQLKALEARIGASLYTRTTRSVDLTDAGRALLARVGPALAEVAGALKEAEGASRTHEGTLRITLPYGAYRLALAPKLAAFRDAYPGIEVELSFEEAFVSLHGRHFHAGVRLGGTIHDDMIAVRLTPPLSDAFFASPAYFETHGRPDVPSDLLSHNCIRYRYIASQEIYPWRFKDGEEEFAVDVKGGLIVNSFDAAVEAARQGIGIAQNFREEIAADIADGVLQTVLDDYTVGRPGFFLYYPREYSRLKLLKVFVDFVRCRA